MTTAVRTESPLSSEAKRAVQVGLLFGLAIVLPPFAFFLSTERFALTPRTALAAAAAVVMLGAAAAFRTRAPTWGRTIIAIAVVAVVAAVLITRQRAPLGTLSNSRFLSGIVLVPFGTWLLTGWKGGLMSLGLMIIWLMIASS